MIGTARSAETDPDPRRSRPATRPAIPRARISSPGNRSSPGILEIVADRRGRRPRGSSPGARWKTSSGPEKAGDRRWRALRLRVSSATPGRGGRSARVSRRRSEPGHPADNIPRGSGERLRRHQTRRDRPSRQQVGQWQAEARPSESCQAATSQAATSHQGCRSRNPRTERQGERDPPSRSPAGARPARAGRGRTR